MRITYLVELDMEPDTNCLVFTLPASVNPRAEGAALLAGTQTATGSVACRLATGAAFGLELGARMPYDILSVWCSHAIETKRTQVGACAGVRARGPSVVQWCSPGGGGLRGS